MSIIFYYNILFDSNTYITSYIVHYTSITTYNIAFEKKSNGKSYKKIHVMDKLTKTNKYSFYYSFFIANELSNNKRKRFSLPKRKQGKFSEIYRYIVMSLLKHTHYIELSLIYSNFKLCEI